MDVGTLALVIPIIALLFVALPAIVLHFITEWRRGSLAPGDEKMMEDLWRTAREMERRVQALESILDHEAPEWRRTARRED